MVGFVRGFPTALVLLTSFILSATASSSTTTPILPLLKTNSSATPALLSSLSTSSASATSTSGPVASASTVVETIASRRIPIIVSDAGDPSGIAQWLSTLQSDGSWPSSEIDYTSGCNAQRANWPAEDHWERILIMASAFHGGTNDTEQWASNTTLLNATQLAMDYWFENDFTDSDCEDSGGTDLCPCGTPGFWNTNWFSNIIGIPQLVIESCLVLSASLTSSELDNCTNIGGRSYANFNRQIVDVQGGLTGANALDVAGVGIDLGLLTSNMSLLSDAYQRVHDQVVIEQALRSDGIRPDGSFGQHEGIIYNGNYGKDFTNDIVEVELTTFGTQFEANETSKKALGTLIDGDLWMIYRNIETNVLHWDFSVLGRFISFPVADAQATGSININITELEVLGQVWESSNLTNAYDALSSNSTSANVGDIVGNRVFFDNDYMVDRGPGYMTTLRMYSSRTTNTECTNSENPFGFHLSDGTVYTYLNGSEYEDIAAAWDWNLIPGTTVDYNATVLTCSETGSHGIEAFVGGVSTGAVGIGAMQYTNPLTKSLSWQKAWFYLGNGVQHVMISNISVKANNSAAVFSVLDQKKLVSDILVDGAVQTSGNFSNVSTLWHGNVGYAFTNISAASLSVDSGERTGNWTALGISTQPDADVELFQAWLTHEHLDADVSYTAYLAVDYETFRDSVTDSSVVEVRNDANVSAIVDEEQQIAMFVFWDEEGGTVTARSNACDITVSTVDGLLIILDQTQWLLTVSDPTQTLNTTQVTVSVGNGDVPAGWSGGSTKTVDIILPTAGIAGSSISYPL